MIKYIRKLKKKTMSTANVLLDRSRDWTVSARSSLVTGTNSFKEYVFLDAEVDREMLGCTEHFGA